MRQETNRTEPYEEQAEQGEHPAMNLGQKEEQEKQTEIIKETNTKPAWFCSFFLFFLSILLLVSGADTAGTISLALALIWIGATGKEIKEPEVAFLFRRGEFKGELKPGWHLPLPLLDEAEVRTTATQEIQYNEEMYCAGKTLIGLEGGIYYRLTDPQKAITIDKETAKNRIKIVSLSKLKGAVGKMPFQNILVEKGEIEGAIREAINADGELREDGYEVTGVEISDVAEKIESEAARIKKIGQAEAEVSEKKAEAMAKPLKDNYPAAIAMSAASLGEKAMAIFSRKGGEK